MKKLLSLIVLVVTFAQLTPQRTLAQGTPSEGKDFYMGFLYPTFNTVIPAFSSGFFRIYALVSSFQENTVYVSYFDPVTGKEEFPQPYKVPKRQTVQIPLSVAKMKMTNPGDQIKEFRSVHITARRPVNVQFFSTGGSSCGSYLCLPTNGLGKQYVVASYNDNPDGEGAMLGGRGPASVDPACGLFMVIAAFDGTAVQITPTSTTQGGNHTGVWYGPGASGVGVPYTISLNRGQCYMVKSWCKDNTSDITGTTIEADKPIAVISGHENASLGGVGNRSLEARDFMVEQMFPVEYWDNTGYVSIPFVDSSPLNPGDDGTGDNFRVITNEKNGAEINMQRSDVSGDIDMNIGLYNTREAFGIEAAVNFYSPTGKKFLPYQIDQCNQSTKDPFPRPSMMQLVPMSRWRNAYLWFVPSNVDERFQAYFINVIGPKGPRNNQLDSIMVSVNGDQEAMINKKLAVRGSFPNIPGHPELKGVRYKVTPGSYYARASFPFMIYHYGNRGIDSDGDLGDFDNDDNFFAYALPLGMVLSTGDTANMTITVDTLCGSWRVCATDHRPYGGIKSMVMLDDPTGDIDIPPPGHRMYAYENASFDPKDDPNNTREIIFNQIDTTACIEVRVDDISKDAYAPIKIIDNSGNAKIIDLFYQKAAIKYTPGLDSTIDFGLHYIGDTKDSILKFINLPTSKKPYIVEELKLLKDDGSFSYQIIKPDPLTTPLPFTISPGDTLIIKVTGKAIDTTYHLDSLKLKTNCFTSYWPLEIEGGTPLIVASDHDFGNVTVGQTRCVDTITITNVGKLPMTIDENYFIHNAVNFSFSGVAVPFGKKLPITLLPKQSIKVRMCYTPTAQGVDTTITDWHTDIRAPYEKDIKSFSLLRGRGIQPDVNWDRPLDTMIVQCDSVMTLRFYLENTASSPQRVDSVFLSGKDADEFIISDKQLPVLANFVIDTGFAERKWFDVQFIPNINKGKDDIREVFLNARAGDSVKTVHITAKILYGVLNINPKRVDLGYIPISTEVFAGFQLQNNGTGTLIIEAADIPPVEITKFEPPLMFPIIMQPGERLNYLAYLVSNKYTDTTIYIVFKSQKPCSNDDTLALHYIVSNKEVQTTGYRAKDTYQECRTDNGFVSITNRGSTALNLRRVEIVNDVPPYLNANEFQFTNGQSFIDFTPSKALAPGGGTEQVPVIFKPLTNGPKAARVRFIYDSAGITVDTVLNQVTGTGVLLLNTFSAANSAPVPYTAQTASVFKLPIRITQPIEQPAGVFGVKFTVTYERDLFRYIDARTPEGNPNVTFTKVTDATSVDPSGRYESLTVHMQTNGQQIMQGMDVADIHFQVMVAKEKVTDFVVSNGAFTDNAGNDLCYFQNDYIPGQFIAEYLCGDPSLNEFLRGVFVPNRITMLTPNPASSDNVKVDYRINVNDLPVTIEVFDVLGAKVKTLMMNKVQTMGDHSVSFATKGLAAGTYTVRISSPSYTQTEQLIINK